MSIASEITRLQGVKSDILQAIRNKGVTVPAGSALANCPGLIASISGDFPEGFKKFSFIRNKQEINTTQISTYIKIDKDIDNANKIIGYEAVVGLYANEYASVFRSFNNTGCDLIVRNQYGSILTEFNNGATTTALSLFNDNVASILAAGLYNGTYKNFYSNTDTSIPSIYTQSQTGGFLIGGSRYNKPTPEKAFNLSRFFVYDKLNEKFLIDCFPARKEENSQIGLFDIVDKIFYVADSSLYELIGITV